MRTSIRLAAMLTLILAAFLWTPAKAADSGDMFHSASPSQPSPTPWVNDSAPGRADFFAVPSQSSQDDMYSHTPHTNNPNGQDLLGPNIDHVPDDPLYKTPKDGIYR